MLLCGKLRFTFLMCILIIWTCVIEALDKNIDQLPEHIIRDRRGGNQFENPLQHKDNHIQKKARNGLLNDKSKVNVLVGDKSQNGLSWAQAMKQRHSFDHRDLEDFSQRRNKINRQNFGKQTIKSSKDNYNFQENLVPNENPKETKNEMKNENLYKHQLKEKSTVTKLPKGRRIDNALERSGKITDRKQVNMQETEKIRKAKLKPLLSKGKVEKHSKNEPRNDKALIPIDNWKAHEGKNLDHHSGKVKDQGVKKPSSFKKTKNTTSLIRRLKPQQIHISCALKMNDIVIMWATFDEEDCFVMYTTNVNQLIVEEGDNYKKQRSTRIEMPVTTTRGTQYIYRAELEGLDPGMKYSYYIKCRHESDLFTFTVPSSNKNSVHSYIVLADMGTETKSLKFIVADAQMGAYNAVFHIGDIAYDLGLIEGQEQIGDKFLNMIEPMAARVPYITIAGDHERFRDYADYIYRFSNPGLSWPRSDKKLWYSFDAGLAHFVCILTEVFSNLHALVPPMMEWLRQDLYRANENRADHPWIIVMGHRPMYCSGDTAAMYHDDCADPNSIVRKYLEDLFTSHGVDLYISGHAHFYERTWPVLRNRVLTGHYKDPIATVHLTVGALGIPYLERKVLHAAGAWSAFFKTGKEIYGKLDIINETHLYWRAVEGKTQAEVDRMMLIQTFHGPFIKDRELHKADPNPRGVHVFNMPERSYERDLYNYCLYLFYFIAFGGALCLIMFRKRIKLFWLVFIK